MSKVDTEVANDYRNLHLEIEKLADHLDALDGELSVDSDSLAAMLRQLLEGELATTLIHDYGLVSNDELSV